MQGGGTTGEGTIIAGTQTPVQLGSNVEQMEVTDGCIGYTLKVAERVLCALLLEGT